MPRHLRRYSITASAIGNRRSDPSGEQPAQDNGGGGLTPSPGAGKSIGNIAGDCPVGTPVANGDGTYALTMGPVTMSCSVVLKFRTTTRPTVADGFEG